MIVHEDDAVTVHHGDCLDVMRDLPDASVDAVVTDPPYGLGFMGKAWDELPPGLPWAQECLRVLKPGGHLLAFGGTRTWHRLAVAVEDAGFEIRDSIAWLHSQGFPKSKQHLKPAFEPVVVARKPLVGPVAGNVAVHGTGALNIDGCRLASDDVPQPFRSSRKSSGGILNGTAQAREQYQPDAGGRWPANVVLDEDTEANLAVARYFYVAKASNKERVKVDGIAHPTVKPLTLMRWLVRLVTPPGGLVLEPFAGSGTTAEACVVEGFQCIAIESEAAYLPLVVARLSRSDLFGGAA